MNARKIFMATFLTLLFTAPAVAGDSLEERTRAAERYANVAPMQTIVDDMVVEMVKILPPEKRQAFKRAMVKALDVPAMEHEAKKAMIKVFSADELNALADFYGSEFGRSSMKKMGKYMGEVMPFIQQRAVKAAQDAAKSI